ncbi:MAG: DNA mismatch repair endonuclease MutL, partial [Proteobacteria bacterium]|nr:DNA mismatch repair endonuclease MutL [Pseudomonadota bacterium]
FSISTFGFRGEALPSIASVSRFTLVTKEKNAQSGIEIKIEGGKIMSVNDKGSPDGTMITVKDLFVNTPARRKFMKSTDTEMGHIADTVASMALGRHDVHFRLLHNGKTVYNWLTVPDSAHRVEDVLGKETRNSLYSLKFQNDNISISGWISSPVVKRNTGRGIYIFVNGRFVRDRVIQHALLEGYSARLIKGQFPFSVIFVNIPYDLVDVNVHPAKREVRFADQNKVHEAVKTAVKNGLDLIDPYKKSAHPHPDPPPYVLSRLVIEEDVTSFSSPPLYSPQAGGKHTSISHPVTQSALWEKKKFKDLRILGQLHGTYIASESGEGIILIDQHAAHERILYEQLKISPGETVKQSVQKLLMPEIIETGYREAGILEKLLPDFQKAGIDIEPFGGNAFAVKSAPAFLADKEVKGIIIEIMEKIIETGFAPGLEKSSDEVMKLVACHGAIRANQQLSDRELRTLVDQLDDCEMPSHCPHGRPTWISFTIKELEKLFKRTG